MPSDNPFTEPDDFDRTIIRPAPGGRRPARPAAPPAPAPSLAPVGETGPATEHVRIGISPLAAAAGPLLQLLSRLRNTVSQPDFRRAEGADGAGGASLRASGPRRGHRLGSVAAGPLRTLR